ncbi:hypothetical protein [Streptomyces sp. NPDC094468]|uniref:hypothetical protein n=1 Tax=Streptomyces sp. NPDC094468 TaxID=3366066 RepID=UPI00382F18BC
MFLVTPDAARGLVAAPHCSDDRTPDTECLLAAQGFTWDAQVEAFTRATDSSPHHVDQVAEALRRLGHFVFSSYRPCVQI